MKVKIIKKHVIIISIISCICLIQNSCTSDDDYIVDGTLASGMQTRSGECSDSPSTSIYMYPSAYEILNDSYVSSQMEIYWGKTVAFATKEGGRREYGFYICHNRKNKSFYIQEISPGTIVNGSCHSSIIFPGTTNTEVCAVFHTHTTLEYCDSTMYRETGPSNSDKSNGHASLMPCFVYDYSSPTISGGDKKNNPATVYVYGTDRR